MNKKTKYARNGAIIFGLVNAALNAKNQFDKAEINLGQKFDWGELLGAAVKGAAAGGAGGFVAGAIEDYQNAKEKPINTDTYLNSVYHNVKLDKNQGDFKWLDDKANRLIYLIKQDLGNCLAAEPTRLGSTEKGTALADTFDIDIFLSFKAGSFGSTAEMYDYVLDFLEDRVGRGSIVEVRDQKKSIGVIYKRRGEEYKIDVVPCKLTQKRGNGTSGYLFLNDLKSPSYTKTDIKALNSLTLNEPQKKIVVVLKHWKNKNDLPLSSYLLENLVIDAYAYNRVPAKLTDKVVMVLEHIRDNLDVTVIRSIENTNNMLTDISDSKKTEIIAACSKAIEEYEYHPNSILEIFKT